MKNQKGVVDVVFTLIVFGIAMLALVSEGIGYVPGTYRNNYAAQKVDPRCVDGTYPYPKDITEDPCIMGDQVK